MENKQEDIQKIIIDGFNQMIELAQKLIEVEARVASLEAKDKKKAKKGLSTTSSLVGGA